MNANLLVCSHCDSEIIVGLSIIPEICIFCGGAVSQNDAEEFVCDFSESYIVPFSDNSTPINISHNVFDWLISQTAIPDDILDNSQLGWFYGIFVPIWQLTGEYEAHWNASCGYKTNEQYTAYESVRENGKEKKIKVTKTRSIISWKPGSGKTIGNFLECGIDADIFDEQLLRFCENAQIRNEIIDKFSAIHLDGYRLKSFRNHLPDNVYDTRIKEKVKRIIEKKVISSIPGDTTKDENWDSRISLQKKLPIYYPFWVAQYTYKDNGYIVLVDGHDNNRIGGEFPTENAKNRRSAYKYSFMPFWFTVALSLTIIAVLHFHFKSLNADNISLTSKIFIPAILISYIFGTIRNMRIKKKQRIKREDSCKKAKSESSFVIGV